MYGITTAAEAEAMLKQQREKLAKSAQAGHSSDTLNSDLQQVAFWEGALEVFGAKERMDERNRPLEKQVMFFARRLTLGADDKWSGRGNDTIRARHDGTKMAVDDVLEKIEYAQNRNA